MRGSDGYNESLFSTVRLEEFVPSNHPLRPIRTWMNEALAKMDERFSAMYEADVKGGRPSIAPEKLLRAMLLQVLYSIRSERQLVEQINYNLLFRWFVGLSIEDAVWNHSVFSKNRDRMIEHDIVIELFNATVEMAQDKGLLSGEHFSVDGTQIKAWAGHKSVRRKDGGDDGRDPEDWRGERRSNENHESKTDPDSQFSARAMRPPRCPASWVAWSPTTVTGWWSTCRPPGQPAPLSAVRPRRCSTRLPSASSTSPSGRTRLTTREDLKPAARSM